MNDGWKMNLKTMKLLQLWVWLFFFHLVLRIVIISWSHLAPINSTCSDYRLEYHGLGFRCETRNSQLCKTIWHPILYHSTFRHIADQYIPYAIANGETLLCYLCRYVFSKGRIVLGSHFFMSHVIRIVLQMCLCVSHLSYGIWIARIYIHLIKYEQDDWVRTILLTRS